MTIETRRVIPSSSKYSDARYQSAAFKGANDLEVPGL
jgi:hypothetical protein